MARRLGAAGVEEVALAVVGPDGVTRVKVVPLRRFELSRLADHVSDWERTEYLELF